MAPLPLTLPLHRPFAGRHARARSGVVSLGVLATCRIWPLAAGNLPAPSVSRETFSQKSMVLTPPRAFATTPPPRL